MLQVISLILVLKLAAGFRIYDGEPTTIKSNPWLASIQNARGQHFCGGSIISQDTILTAAHCTVTNSQYPMMVRVGTTDKTSGGSFHQVRYIYQHPKFEMLESKAPINDISLLKLATPINFTESSARPIGLFEQYEVTPERALATISGWGIEKTGGKTPNVLNTVKIPIVGKFKCNQVYKKVIGTLPHGQICAGYANSAKNSCQGDSGSPVVVGGRQAGIVSWGLGCGLSPGYPGVYTEVAFYRDWIRQFGGV